MSLPTLNPLNNTSLGFFDLGDVESPDGRAHPVTAQTPVSVVSTDPKPATQTPNVPIYVPGVGTISIPGSGSAVNAISNAWPSHFGARLALGVLAIGILLVVAFRLSK